MKRGLYTLLVVIGSLAVFVFAWWVVYDRQSGIPQSALTPSFATSTQAQPTGTSAPTATKTPMPLPTFTTSPQPTATNAPTATPFMVAERVPLLEYHHSDFKLNDQVMMTQAWFEEQMRWLSENDFHTISPEDLLSFLDGKNLPARSVLLTFDIGTAQRKDFAEIIVPTLKKYHQQAVFFLLVNENVVNDTCNVGNRLCWKELKQWQDDGVVSVQSHGIYHQSYPELKADEIKYDAGESKRLIEFNLGKPVLMFAYPYDATSAAAMKLVEGLGYQIGVGGYSRSDRSAHQLDELRFNLPRVYPYSNPAIYPAINGANGKSFGQMMLDATGTPIAAVVPTAVRATATPTGEPTEADPQARLLSFCRKNPEATGADWYAALQLREFPTDLSQAALDQLQMGVTVRPSCNILPGNQPKAIVLHYTDGALEASLSEFESPHKTSSHYIIDRDGTVYQVVAEKMVAFHVSCYGDRSTCLDSCPICDNGNGRFKEPYEQSIGIELVNNGAVAPGSFQGDIYEDYSNAFGYRYWEDYPPAQIQSLKVLVEDIRARWDIPWGMVMGHSRVNTKPDPGPALNLFWTRYGYPARPPIFDINLP